MIRTLVADDHPVVRQGIRQILAETQDIVVSAEARDGAELLARAGMTGHDLVLLDLSMPGIDGLDVLKQLKQARPKIPVLILTMASEDRFAIRAFRAGASGYVVKDSAPAELVAAIRRVAAGGRYVSAIVAEQLAGHLSANGAEPVHERLSDREYQVFRMIAAGMSTRRIAGELSLSIKTIGTYRTRIFEKMGVRTPAELASYGVRNHLAD